MQKISFTSSSFIPFSILKIDANPKVTSERIENNKDLFKLNIMKTFTAFPENISTLSTIISTTFKNISTTFRDEKNKNSDPILRKYYKTDLKKTLQETCISWLRNNNLLSGGYPANATTPQLQRAWADSLPSFRNCLNLETEEIFKCFCTRIKPKSWNEEEFKQLENLLPTSEPKEWVEKDFKNLEDIFNKKYGRLDSQPLGSIILYFTLNKHYKDFIVDSSYLNLFFIAKINSIRNTHVFSISTYTSKDLPYLKLLLATEIKYHTDKKTVMRESSVASVLLKGFFQQHKEWLHSLTTDVFVNIENIPERLIVNASEDVRKTDNEYYQPFAQRILLNFYLSLCSFSSKDPKKGIKPFPLEVLKILKFTYLKTQQNPCYEKDHMEIFVCTFFAICTMLSVREEWGWELPKALQDIAKKSKDEPKFSMYVAASLQKTVNEYLPLKSSVSSKETEISNANKSDDSSMVSRERAQTLVSTVQSEIDNDGNIFELICEKLSKIYVVLD